MFPLISVDGGSCSLCTRLGKGLESCLGSCLNGGHVSYINSQQLAKNLQQELLNFTQRLHASELERRDLRAALSLTQRGVSNDEKQETTDQLKAELASLRDQFETAVPVSKFTQVCEELARTLEREEQLQAVLEVQKEQLEEQVKLLYVLNNKGIQQENLSNSAGKHSSDLRVELQSKDHLVQRLTRQISILDEEKTSLLNKISDAERMLHVASREKQLVIGYVNSLSNWFKQMPSAENGKWDIDALFDFGISDAKPSAELSAVHGLLSAFIETLNSVFESSRSFGCENCAFKDTSKGKTNQKLNPEIKTSKNKDSFRPFVIDSDPGPLKVKVSVKGSRGSQKKTTDKKPKSMLPRHQGLRVATRRSMSSHRYPSSEAAASVSAAARNVSKVIVS